MAGDGQNLENTKSVQHGLRKKKKKNSEGQDANKVYEWWQEKRLEQKPACTDIWSLYLVALGQN